MTILVVASGLVLALLTGVYVALTFFLLRQAQRANKLNVEAFEKRFTYSTHPLIFCQIAVNDSGTTLTVSNYGTRPFFDVDIVFLGMLYNDSDVPYEAFVESYVNPMVLPYHKQFVPDGEGAYSLSERALYRVFPPRHKVSIKQTYPVIPSGQYVFVQFSDVTRTQYGQLYLFSQQKTGENYRLTGFWTPQSLPVSRLEPDMGCFEIQGNGPKPDYGREFQHFERAFAISLSLKCLRGRSPFESVEDVGYWESID